MHHHTHIPRRTSQMRNHISVHRNTTETPTGLNVTHISTVGLVPPPPATTTQQHFHLQPSQSHKFINSVVQVTTSPLLQHHKQLGQHHNSQLSSHGQKIGQHNYLNNLNKSSLHHPLRLQHQLPFNTINVSPPQQPQFLDKMQQHLRNVPSYHLARLQQEQKSYNQHMLYLKNQQHVDVSNVDLATQQIEHQILATNVQQHHRCYHSSYNNKIKYNHTANFNNTTKFILQNPNRPFKSSLQICNIFNKTTTATTTDEITLPNQSNKTVRQSGNKITSDPDFITTVTPAVTSINVEQCTAVDSSILESNSTQLTMTDIEVCSQESNKENIPTPNKIEPNNLFPKPETTFSKNSGEKTPMCLVNDLARYNKVALQYSLTNEEGPAHCKRFTVTLKLGDEEYSAEGLKIKKAQHLAATEAIEKTKYKHPIPKNKRRNEQRGSARVNITPTVELNALAMKLGQQTYYLMDPLQHNSAESNITPHSSPPQSHLSQVTGSAYVRCQRSVHISTPISQSRKFCFSKRRYPSQFPQHYPMIAQSVENSILTPSHTLKPLSTSSVPCRITLIVGNQQFVGTGRTLQQAKHDAAARALQVLKAQVSNQLNEMLNENLKDSDSKSPISLVFEIGIKRNLPVNFKVLREEGPAHMRNFITACTVGTLVTEGEGTGKKISKKRAAQKMLEELKKLPPIIPPLTPVKRIKAKGSTKAPNAFDEKSCSEKVERRMHAIVGGKDNLQSDEENENHTTKLIELHQSHKKKEPLFKLLTQDNNEKSRRRELAVDVSSQSIAARGTGNSKKLAKRNAAQKHNRTVDLTENTESKVPLKDLSGSSLPNQALTDTVVTTDTLNKTGSSVVKDISSSTLQLNHPLDTPLISTPAGDVLILRQGKKHTSKKKGVVQALNSDSNAYVKIKTLERSMTKSIPALVKSSRDSTAAYENNSEEAKVCSNPKGNNMMNIITRSNQNSPAENGSSHERSISICKNNTVHMKDQLLYLAKLLDFEVKFSDYPKGNHNEFLTIVMLSTNPSQICHGVGGSAEESQDDAAKNALKILSEMGLNNAKMT